MPSTSGDGFEGEPLMKVSRKRVGVALAGLGLVGVASLALLPVERLASGPLPLPVIALRLLSLVNPALLVIAAAWIGAVLAPRIGLEAPAVRLALAGTSPGPVLRRQARPAGWIGLCTGLLLAGYAAASGPYFASLDAEAASRIQALTPPLATRLLYGGLTEEIVARWGVMTLVGWLAWRLLGRPGRPVAGAYWVGIMTAALVFALAHLPFLYGIAGDPPLWLILSALAANGLAGAVFGWLFWRRGLEAAMLAHALAHVVAALIASVVA
jgi:hypothetical protein